MASASGTDPVPSPASSPVPSGASVDEAIPPPATPTLEAADPPLEVAAQTTEGLQTVALPTHPSRPTGLTPPAAEPGHDHEPEASAPVVQTGEIEVEPFQLAAVTWPGSEHVDVTAWVRVRSGGAWSPWYEVPGADEHGPDPGTAEAAQSRGGTDPLLVPRSDAVQVRVDAPVAAVPAELRLDLVDPAATDAGTPDPGVASPLVPQEATGPVETAPQPAVRSRAAWGADESLRPDPPEYGVVNGAFVHHTVNANNYTEAEVPAIIRSIYVYHVTSRGWNDLGYNFLVDRFGRIWEGRYGGISRAVIGAHTQGYNDDAFAMSAIGTYTDAAPSSAMISAYRRLFAWKFGVHQVDPRHRVNYDGQSWPAIAGHRDAASTACPGDALYAKLDSIRSGTIVAMGLAGDQTLGRDLDGRGHDDIVARRRSDGSLWLWPGDGRGTHGSGREIGARWSAMNALLLPGDWNGDGHDDLVGRRRSDGSMWLYRGSRFGTLGGGVPLGHGWSAFRQLVAVGDWSGDGRPDLMGVRSDGTLWLFAGDGAGGFRSSVQIGRGWYGDVIGVGDWGGDGEPDVMLRRSDGALIVYNGDGRGRFGSSRQIGHGWQAMSEVSGVGDTNGDRQVDLAAWNSAGELIYYFGDGRGGFLAVRTIGPGWNAYDLRS